MSLFEIDLDIAEQLNLLWKRAGWVGFWCTNILYTLFLKLIEFLYLRIQIFDFILPFSEQNAQHVFVEDTYSKCLKIPYHMESVELGISIKMAGVISLYWSVWGASLTNAS